MLDTDEETEHAEHAGRHAEIETDAICMPGAGSGTRTDYHLVTGHVLDHLLNQRKHCRTPTVDETLTADLDDVGIGQELNDGLSVEQGHLRLISRTRTHASDGHAIDRLDV